MQLTQHTDFGLRLLIALARRGGEAMSLPSFASEQGLSYNHVIKVAQALARVGLVVSHRGRSGGVSLARSTDDMTLGDVVRALEPGMRLADCAGCALRTDCTTSNVLADALAAFLTVLDRTTLTEAAKPGRPAFAPWAIPRTGEIDDHR